MRLFIIPALEVAGFSGTVQGLGVQLTGRAECTDDAHVTDGPVRTMSGAVDQWRWQGKRWPEEDKKGRAGERQTCSRTPWRPHVTWRNYLPNFTAPKYLCSGIIC